MIQNVAVDVQSLFLSYKALHHMSCIMLTCIYMLIIAVTAAS